MNIAEQQRLAAQIRTDYADIYDTLAWIDHDRAKQARIRRAALLADIGRYPDAQWQFSETKLVSRDLSPGCRLCGQGDWSCLFINNLCNAACFYCPASQKDLAQPATGRLEFSDPEAYADYVNTFDIKGVSFSGGEPLISFDRVMAFLTVLRKRIDRPLYIWMYTNGILASEEKFTALARAGLDEVRFDLSATDYDLSGLKKAVGIIPRITVEIPAIPHDMERLKPLLGELSAMGVNYLNLHQIRCTRFNAPKLAAQGYTFVHGYGITVLETELAALELIRYSLEHQIPLPINYCAFTFRHQFQRAGAQKRNAARVKSPWETITLSGQIRTTTLTGDPALISDLDERLRGQDKDPSLWQISGKGDQMQLNAELLKTVNTVGLSLKVTHSGTSLSPRVSYRHRFTQISLNPKTSVVVERFPRHGGVVLTGDQIPWYLGRYIDQENRAKEETEQTSSLAETEWELLDRHEVFSPGLAPYF